jgi:hypothetical protein
MDIVGNNKNLMRRIVRAIDKAIVDDVPEYLREHHKETNNAVIQLRGDCINDNLRKLVVGGDIELISFKRCAWQGRLLVDRSAKITYTIANQKTLHAIPRKWRGKPHFLQSLLYIENSGYEAPVKQLTLMESLPFEAEELENDYNAIVAGLINPGEGYRHYVIAYDAEGSELKDIQVEFLDKDFNIIETASLNEYIEPDFARLTNVEHVDEDLGYEIDGEAKGLVAIKSGLRPKLKEVQKQA